MERTFVTFALMLVAAATVAGRPARQKGDDASKALVQVMRLEGRWARAVVRRDDLVF